MMPHPERFPDVTIADIAAELERELAARRRVYEPRVAKGNMTRADANQQIQLAEAIAADLPRFARAIAERVNPLALRCTHEFSWADRRRAILRELDLRDRHYPAWIGNGTLDQAEADRRVARLEAMLAFYEDGYDWKPANGVMPRHALIKGTPEQEASRIEWATTADAIRTRQQPPQQEALAL